MDTPPRCGWVPLNKPLYVQYHDEEWGVPVHDDKRMFEFLVLESFQAGLSWEIILNKRENFRRAFAAFDVNQVAAFGEADIHRLLQDRGIVRNQLKIRAAVNNARRYQEVAETYGSFCNYLWEFTEGKPLQNRFKQLADLPASTPLSETISRDLKQRGFKFLGSTVIYAHMQAVGMVNDHLEECFRYGELLQ